MEKSLGITLRITRPLVPRCAMCVSTNGAGVVLCDQDDQVLRWLAGWCSSSSCRDLIDSMAWKPMTFTPYNIQIALASCLSFFLFEVVVQHPPSKFSTSPSEAHTINCSSTPGLSSKVSALGKPMSIRVHHKKPCLEALGPDAPILGWESTDGGSEVRNLLKFGNGAPMKNGV